eukprot:1227300-Pyramimonas_sp.AAC.1
MLGMKRKPAEGNMQFNRRFAQLISKWFGALGARELHERALQAIHANAWRESNHDAGRPGADNLLGEIRTARGRT